MVKEARHHHYIPQCYLRGFANGSGKKCKLTVAVLKSQQMFETNPRNVCGIRDFNRVQVEGLKPDALEGMFADFEGQVATAIRSVMQSSRFDGDDRNAILNLVALLAVRSPQQRENWRQFEEQIMKRIIGLSLATKERWGGQMRQMKEAGYKVDESLTYEDMRKFYEEDKYDIRLNKEHHIGLELHGCETILPFLDKRTWALYTTTENEGLFLTTDRPVLLTWNHPQDIPMMMRRSPGFGMTDTEVLFPLTQHAVLVGEFESKEGTFPATVEFVARANSKMLCFAFEQVYLPKRTIWYMTPDGQFHHDRHFMERFDEARKQAVKPASSYSQ